MSKCKRRYKVAWYDSGPDIEDCCGCIHDDAVTFGTARAEIVDHYEQMAAGWRNMTPKLWRERLKKAPDR